MTRVHKAVALAALTVAVAATAASPAMAASHKSPRTGVATYDHHVPITGNLITSDRIETKDRHRP
ncbi:hypothetical protein BX264_2948 [Streptomyces sp. 2333.5]|uniref:hypothetical protein n=1 Tax=Streptomyces TaxID=1883 RepID=UPI000894D961|nr:MULTISPECIES: hypothetical protein [unclassified Streptomyces]PJJ02600.1 hypothetical protein BX264_2948 [Streptomyces sp. 2333.5]SED17516.1 hypothetical protein SAMN05428943_3088 [Streptomyces sp. 2314.4]SEE05367.1 hypothetical protein SAMN05428942_3051 [Streptomyces sp. 2112.2]